jgi:hypothetical protein
MPDFKQLDKIAEVIFVLVTSNRLQVINLRFMRRFYAYLDWHARVPRIRHGARSSIETLIREEALLLAIYLRNEKKESLPRIGITL